MTSHFFPSGTGKIKRPTIPSGRENMEQMESGILPVGV